MTIRRRRWSGVDPAGRTGARFGVPLLLLVLTGLPGVAIRVQAQETWSVSRAAASRDVASLDGIIAAFYDVISGSPGDRLDWTRDSTLYLPGVRFVIGNRTREGTFRARNITHATYAVSTGDTVRTGFHEREIHRVTQRFGPIVHVFSTYEWRRTPDGPVGGRGINSLQLFHDGQRWWITSALWVAEDDANPIPAEFLPRGGGS